VSAGPATAAPPSGILVVDKPSGWTSHDVVGRVRRLAGTRKVGHAGTLDPMATGVLVLGLGPGTRLLTYLVGADKTYEATIRLGVSTVTDDAEGDVLATTDACDVRPDRLAAAVAELTGPIEQRPSAVSAIKVDGKRAYARVRAGEQVELKARPVTVHRFELRGQRPGEVAGSGVLDLDVEVDVSSGTYVRALARDLGEALGVGGHLTALRRTRVGPFGLDVARTLSELEQDFGYEPLAAAARAAFPARELAPAEVQALRYGQVLDPTGSGESPVAGFGPAGDLVALLHDVDGRARSLFVVPA
jgi:tRNA pseudouridine55 synthase